MGEIGGSAATIVVAEDNFLTSHLIVATLERAGYSAFSARDGDAFVKLLQKHRPRVVIVNLNISRPSGMELLRSLRKNFPEIRAIVFLSPSQADLRPQAADLGAEAFFESPFEPDALVRDIERLMGE